MPAIAPLLSADLDFRLIGGGGLDVAEENESDCRVAVELDIVVDAEADKAHISKFLG